MSNYAIGLDYGTNSCRALIVDLSNGEELASHVFNYPTGEAGVIVDASDPNLARQNPADYVRGAESTIIEAIKKAKSNYPDFLEANVIGIGVDTTGSSPLPVDSQGTPLSYQEKFKDNPAAYVWLWKDHTSYQEALDITEIAAKMRPKYLDKIGGTYSSEWFWSKIWNIAKNHPDLFDAAYSFVEICDWIPAVLAGDTNPDRLKRSVCAAGHKAMFHPSWGGLPDGEFLDRLSPGLSRASECSIYGS